MPAKSEKQRKADASTRNAAARVKSENMALRAFTDRSFYTNELLRHTGNAVTGLASGVLGAPVDLMTLALRPLGYNAPSERVIGSSEWLGRMMNADTESPSFIAGTIGPVPDATDAMRIAPAIAGVASRTGRFLGDALDRLKKAGFDTDTPLYHGTSREFDRFHPGSYFAVDRDYSEDWIRDDAGDIVRGGHIRTVYLRGRQYEADEDEASLIFADPGLLEPEEAYRKGQLLEELAEEGYSSVYSPINGGEVYVLNPNDVVDAPDAVLIDAVED